VDADLVALGGHGADLVGVQQGGDGGVEEAGLDAFALEQPADAGHGGAAAVLALADAHRALIGVAQRYGLVVGVEGDGEGAAGAAGPGGGGEAASGAGAADDAAPGGFAPLPGLAVRVLGLTHGDNLPR